MRWLLVVLCLTGCTGSLGDSGSLVGADAGGDDDEPDRDAGSSGRDAARPPEDAAPARDASLVAPGDARVDDAAGPNQELTLALYNVVRAEPLEQLLTAVVQRVELPPQVTIAATSSRTVGAVRFLVDAAEVRFDSSAPFLLSEGEDGAPLAWDLTPGSHQVEARAYASPAGDGAVLAMASWSFEYARAGLQEGFTPLSDEANEAWVRDNLEDVMVARTFDGSQGSLPYRLFVPEQYDAALRYPLLVYLHGRSERGSDNRSAIYRNSQLFAGPRSIVSPNVRDEFPAIVVVPQCGDEPAHQEWAHWVGNSEAQPFAGLGSDGSYMQHPDPWPSELHVRELVEALQAELSIDPDRVYLTGESMGGFGTWDITTRWPELWAAGVPMAGYSDPTLVQRIVGIPFWVFHGSSDDYNPVQGSRAMTAALSAAGGEVKYTEYMGLEHVPTFQRAWREEPELLPWLFSQRRRAP